MPPLPLVSSLLFSALILFQPQSAVASEEARLRLKSQDRTQSFSLSDLRSRLEIKKVTIDDPVYKSKKTYEAFRLKDLFRLAKWNLQKGGVANSEWVLLCSDGYAPRLSGATLSGTKSEPWLAFRDIAAQGSAQWLPFKEGKEKTTPAPFYLIWKNGDASLPWPYQLVEIEWVNLGDLYSRIIPKGLAPEALAVKGFELFRQKCIQCHSANLQGGDKGPELNYPKNILEYWKRGTLVSFIQSPSSFRARSKMPDFPELKGRDMDALMAYLEWLKGNKRLK